MPSKMASHIFFLCNLNWEVHSKPSSKSRGSKWEVRLNSPERNRRKFYTIQTGQMQQAEGWPGQEGLSGPKTQGQQQMASKEPARSSESLSQPQFLRGSCAPAPGWQWDSFYWLSCTLNLTPVPTLYQPSYLSTYIESLQPDTCCIVQRAAT